MDVFMSKLGHSHDLMAKRWEIAEIEASTTNRGVQKIPKECIRLYG